MSGFIPKLSNLTGNASSDIGIIGSYLNQLYKSLFFENKIVTRLDAIAAVPENVTVISNPPTQAEMQTLQATLNAVINAAQNSGVST